MSVVRFRGLNLFLDQKCIHTYNLERGGLGWDHRDTNGKGNEIFKKRLNVLNVKGRTTIGLFSNTHERLPIC